MRAFDVYVQSSMISISCFLSLYKIKTRVHCTSCFVCFYRWLKWALMWKLSYVRLWYNWNMLEKTDSVWNDLFCSKTCDYTTTTFKFVNQKFKYSDMLYVPNNMLYNVFSPSISLSDSASTSREPSAGQCTILRWAKKKVMTNYKFDSFHQWLLYLLFKVNI